MGEGVIVGVNVFVGGINVFVGEGVFDGVRVGGEVRVGVGLGAAAMILKLSVLAPQLAAALWKTDTLNNPGK